MIKLIRGNLLESDAKYIVHQTNCLSHAGGGLAYHLFEKFPFADTYKNRTQNDEPGTIVIRGNGQDQRYVVNLMGQYGPGLARPLSDNDTEKHRKSYFINGLWQLSKVDNLESIAFPYLIGCGLAGGDWNWYLDILLKFSDHLKDQTDVFLYKLD